MRYRKLMVYLATIVFAAAMAFFLSLDPGLAMDNPISLVLTASGDEKHINCWKNEAGEYFLFLPSYAQSASLQLRTHAANVKIDGKEVENGLSCDGFPADKSFAFSFDTKEGTVHSVLTFVKSKELPTLYIDSGSGSMDYIHEEKGNMEGGRFSLYMPDGEISCGGILDEIKGRGNDWLIPKKSYSLQLASDADLLGMGQAEKWILLSNAFDPSHVRNKLIYDFAGEVGLDFSPESTWVDLYLNGEYAGLYLLCERNELHPQRVSLEGEGQYLVSMDLGWRLEQNRKPFLTTDAGYSFRVHDSQLEDAALQRLLQSVENAITAENGIDPLTGKHWTELIDLDSWVKKYLLEEVFGNGDGGAISQYYYGSSDDLRMYAGPAWDYDVSMGNALAWRVKAPNSLFAGRPRIWSSISPSWYYGLYQQDSFYERMTQEYQEVFLPLLDTFLNEKMEEYIAFFAQASAMNQIRWNNLEAAKIPADQEAENIRSYMEKRIDFLNQLWLEEAQIHWVLIDPGDDTGTLCFGVQPGQQIPFLPKHEDSPEILGWYIAGTDVAFDGTQPIYEDTEIILKRMEPASVLEEPAEPEEKGRRISFQYVPAVFLLGVLGICCLIDSVRRRKHACGQMSAMEDKDGHCCR